MKGIVPGPDAGGGLTIGVDVGGTFTDVLVLDGRDSSLSVLKVPTSSRPSDAVVKGICSMLSRGTGVSFISHATTIATNALLTRAGLARTALVTNAGFRDVLEIGRQRRPEVYNLQTRRPTPLVRRRDRLTVRCRVSADGAVVQPVSRADAVRAAKRIGRGGFESVAVSFLHSYVNGAHEVQMARTLRAQGFRGHISLSSEVDREYREYERTSTTVVNAALAPLISSYLSELKRSLDASGVGAPVYVMNSDGGMGTLSVASARPVSTIESGPAAGVMASRVLARRLSLGRVITFDMGGTTAKAGTVVGGEPDITYEFEAAGRTHSGRSISGSGYVVRGPFVDVAEVSAGGGTVAWVDDGGALAIGPMSAGSEPGPACYGRGGTRPTVTDANVLLGKLNPRYLLGGAMQIHARLAASAFGKLASRLGMPAERAAQGVIRLANSSMSKAISIVSLERGRDPRGFSMVAFGGAGPVHCCDIAEELGITEIIVPVHAGLYSAFGLLAADLSRSFAAAVSRGQTVSASLAKLRRQAAVEMKRDGLNDFTSRAYADLRYVGQSHELTLPLNHLGNLKAAFDATHRRLYGYAADDDVEVVNVRLRVVAKRRATAALSSRWGSGVERPGRRRVWLSSRYFNVDVYTREKMKAGTRGVGPCVIEEYDSTLVVNPSWRWKVEDYGTRLTR